MRRNYTAVQHAAARLDITLYGKCLIVAVRQQCAVVQMLGMPEFCYREYVAGVFRFQMENAVIMADTQNITPQYYFPLL